MRQWCALFIPGLWLQSCETDDTRANILVGDGERVLQLDRAAFRSGARVGMKRAMAESLDARLRVHTLSPAARGAVMARVAKTLERFTPRVEIVASHPGVFLLDPRGMEAYWGNHSTWMDRVRQGLQDALGLVGARSALGWSREAVCWIAKMSRDDTRFRDPTDETRCLEQTPLIRATMLSASSRAALRDVGLKTVADLLALQRASVRERLGEEIATLHRALSHIAPPPLTPYKELLPLQHERQLESETTSKRACEELLSNAISEMIASANARREELLEVSIRLEDRCGEGVTLSARAPRPTNAPGFWTRALRDRLATTRARVVVEVVIASARSARRVTSERALDVTRRDLDAGLDVLAHIASIFGHGAVRVFANEDAHCPVARARLAPLKTLTPAKPTRDRAGRPWVRTIEREPKRAWRAPRGECEVFDVSDPWRGIWRRYHREREGAAPMWFVEDRLEDTWHILGAA